MMSDRQEKDTVTVSISAEGGRKGKRSKENERIGKETIVHAREMENTEWRQNLNQESMNQGAYQPVPRQLRKQTAKEKR